MGTDVHHSHLLIAITPIQVSIILNTTALKTSPHLVLLTFFLRFYLFTFRERRREEERGEKHQCVRDISCFSQGPILGTWPATQAYALMGN